MGLIEINKNPSEKDLRQFAAIWFPAFFLLVGVIIGRKFGGWNVIFVVWSAVAILSIAGAMRPRLMRPIFVGWMYAAFPIGWLVSHLILAITYYLVITPIGLVMRAFGKDPMQRRIDKSAGSYWIKREQQSGTSRYFKQF